MASYELRVSIASPTTLDCASVRAWVDGNLDDDLESEEELDLAREADGSWSGKFRLTGRARAFAYRVGLLGERGAVWSLLITECGSARRRLLEDSDMLEGRKEWLLGTCDSYG